MAGIGEGLAAEVFQHVDRQIEACRATVAEMFGPDADGHGAPRRSLLDGHWNSRVAEVGQTYLRSASVDDPLQEVHFR
ncbi:hypothetical protein D9M70_561970 [compost metagenome]